MACPSSIVDERNQGEALHDFLQRAGIMPYAWIINQSFSMNGVSDPLLIERAAQELPFIQEVQMKLAGRIAVVPWTSVDPVGPEALRRLARVTADSIPVEVEAQ